MNWHSISAAEALKHLGSNAQTGLSENTARARLERDGENKLEEKKGLSLPRRFLRQFSDFCIIILFIACIVSLITGFLEENGDFIDPIVILVIVILNAVIGVIQESKAERALEALRKLSAPSALVLRSGALRKIPAVSVVTGDIIKLTAGDSIPADARLIESSGMKVQESALTGESVPTEKNAALLLPENCTPADMHNYLFASTTVTVGSGVAVVTATGMNTKVGSIAGMLNDEQAPQTPLQIRLAKVGKALGIGAVCICAMVFLLGVAQGTSFLNSFMLSVSLAVAAIPEGLPAIVTVVLSIGVSRMAKSNAVIRRLPAVETLGAATVICSDKTGTLTQNKMKVTELFVSGGRANPSSQEAQNLLQNACLCINSVLSGKGSKQTITGDPTENAILAAALDAGLPAGDYGKSYPRISETPFDSSRKLMSTVCRVGASNRMIVKGAPDVLLPLCTSVLKRGAVTEMNSVSRNAIARQNELMAKNALRVIAVAYRTVESGSARESDLVFLGLIGMLDPVREQAAQSVEICKKAGITPVMITGDHAATACAVADKLGMLDGAQAITGAQLDLLSDQELNEKIKDCRVFARVTPEHKVRIVKAYRARGEIVAMTGDGVNDAPALKAADIGCAMGKSGTQVAKNAADMVLTDDDFSTIVKAVEQGRGIYDNIKKAVHFLLSSNIGEILAIFLSVLLGFPAPLIPLQLLWVNLVTDSLPAMALGTEAPDENIMERKPVPPSKGFFVGGLWLDIMLEGALVGVITLLAFGIGSLCFGADRNVMLGQTMAFCTLSFCELVFAVNMRSEHSIFKIGFFSNKKMVFSIIVCGLLQLSVILIPALRTVFKVCALSGMQWAVVAILSLMPLIIGEIGKITPRKIK